MYLYLYMSEEQKGKRSVLISKRNEEVLIMRKQARLGFRLPRDVRKFKGLLRMGSKPETSLSNVADC